jgi:hypothetical protein
LKFSPNLMKEGGVGGGGGYSYNIKKGHFRPKVS